MKTNENTAKRCLLAAKCNIAGTPACNAHCVHWIALHGMSGLGGRAAAANVPADYRQVTVENSPARASQPKVYPAIDAYVKTFERQFDTDAERLKSVYLYSANSGTGKSTTAAALINTYIITHYLGSLQRSLQPDQHPAYFHDCNAWQTDYNNFNRPKVPDHIAEPAAKRYYAAMERAKHAPIAVLDDLGVRDSSEGFRGDLHAVINHRVTNQLPTIYTSNLPIFYGKKKDPFAKEPYDLVDVFGEARLADRINEMCLTLTFEGESKRGMRR